MDSYFRARDILGKAMGTDSYFQIKSILFGLKAADVVEVRHGRWIELSRSSKCSECEFETGRYEPARKFCPACGALMDGEETPTCHDGVCEIPGVERKEGNHVE